MNSTVFFIVFVVLVVILYRQKKKKFNAENSGNSAAGNSGGGTRTSSTSKGSEGELMSIINKTGRLFMTRKYDAALQLINDNIDNFKGEQKAQLLNQRGGLHSIKGDHTAALPDFKEAYQLDDSITNLTNYVEVLVRLKMYDEARPIAEQGLRNPNIRGSERKTLETAMSAVA